MDCLMIARTETVEARMKVLETFETFETEEFELVTSEKAVVLVAYCLGARQ